MRKFHYKVIGLIRTEIHKKKYSGGIGLWTHDLLACTFSPLFHCIAFLTEILISLIDHFAIIITHWSPGDLVQQLLKPLFW